MKVFLDGKWYDSKEVPIVVKLDDSDKHNISNMPADHKYYVIYPDSLEKDKLDSIIKEIENEKQS